MMNPFAYRPATPTNGDDDETDWEDNWLSNALAWASARKPFAKMCKTPEHWTSRLTNYIFTDCPCCLFFRGVTFGFAAATLIFLPLAILF